MPRPRKRKLIRGPPIPASRAIFKPAGVPTRQLEVNILTMVEFEAIRLIDANNKSQSEAADMMDISQPTISRILKSGRGKLADALVNGKAIRIEGGDFRLAFKGYGCLSCDNEWKITEKEPYAPENCPKCNSEEIFILKREM